MQSAAVAERPFARIGNHISHSQVNSFDRCQLAWFFRYIQGIEKLPTVQMLVGSCYHKALARNFEQKLTTGSDLPPQEVIAHYRDCFDSSVTESNIYVAVGQDFNEFREAVAKLLEHYYCEYVIGKMEPVLVEHQFACRVPGCERPLVGVIDVQLSDGRMIDFKVTSRKWTDADAVEDKQATAYALLYGYPVEFEYHIGLRANKRPAIQVVKTRRGANDVENYIQHLCEVTRQMKDLEEGRAEPVPCTNFCNEKICQFYSECQDWKYGSLG